MRERKSKSAVAASQTSSCVGVVPILHIHFSNGDSLPECFMEFCISTHHESGKPTTSSSAVVGILTPYAVMMCPFELFALHLIETFVNPINR